MTGRGEATMRREAVLGELHSLCIPQWRCAELLKISPPGVSTMSKRLGLRFCKAWMRRDIRGSQNQSKSDSMAALYRAGYTLKQIGEQYGLTRERVRQILKKYKGMNGNDGGQHVVAEAKERHRVARLNANSLRKYGCSFEQWQAVRDIGRGMGVGAYRTPLGAFRSQRNNAKARGIGWELTFWQWWCVWQSSGRWEQRGRGDGYVMCRNGDLGPYAVDNVFIATAAENSADGQAYRRKDSDLPIGVSRTRSGRFAAIRRGDHLGTFGTPEAAHAAYLVGVRNKPKRQHGDVPRGYTQRGGKFCAYVYDGKKYIHLGTFSTADEAHAAHLAARAQRLDARAA